MPASLHVYSEGYEAIERNLLFRDRLRRVPEERVLYEQTKRELARRIWQDVQNYADAKSDVVEAIIARARAEREMTSGINMLSLQMLGSFREYLNQSHRKVSRISERMRYISATSI